jgi:hypothetical protein
VKQHQTSIGKNDEWLTPPEILKHLGPFDLDPCSAIVRPWNCASVNWTIVDDGLNKDWFGRVWLNPPFNRYERPKWMEKMQAHNNGIMLIPAACETASFYQHVCYRASGILMLEGRPHFYFNNGNRAKANSGCTICLVAYGLQNLNWLQNSNLGIVLSIPRQ